MSLPIQNLAATLENCDYVTLTSSDCLFTETDHSSPIPLLQVTSPLCHAVIAPQGAQLLSHRSEDGRDLLWLSPKANFAAGKSIRGGIPICLPWFGKHPDSKKPQHGFARNEEWQLLQATNDNTGKVELTWLLNQHATAPHALFNWTFNAQLVMTLGRKIKMRLHVTNLDSTPMPLSWALHSYHPVSELSRVKITGLDGCDYLDNTHQLERFSQQGDICFDGEFDRIYLSVPASQTIETTDPIRITGEQCYSAIVWNPGAERAAAMIDIGSENYTGFVCLERGNASDNAVTLQPGETHQACITIEFSEA